MSLLHVVFRVGDAEYVLPAQQVLHMETYQGATPVPGALPYIVGVVQLRQRLVPVIDLRRRLGLPPEARSLHSRVIVVQHDDRVVGLLADSAREVMVLAAEDFAPPPEVVARQIGVFVQAVARAGARLLMLLDTLKVIGEMHAKETVPS